MMRNRDYISIIVRSILVVFLAVSCSTTKYIEDGDYLLDKYKIELNGDAHGVSKSDLYDYVVQEPNSPGIFFNKTSLRFYSLSGRDTSKWINRAIRKIGEVPVVYSSEATEKSRREMTAGLMNLGFFNAKVDTSVTYKKKKARVKYIVSTGEPYKIRQYEETTGDINVDGIISNNRNLKSDKINIGTVYNAEKLDNRINAITSAVRSQGYYNFNKDNLYYTVDTAYGDNTASIALKFKGSEIIDTTSDVDFALRRYRIGNVSIRSMKTPNGQRMFNEPCDTVRYKGVNIYYDKGRHFLKPKLLYNNTYIRNGRYYSDMLHERTYTSLSGLSAINQTTIQYRRDTLPNVLNASVNVTRSKVYYWQFGIDGTNSAGDFGVESYITYQDKNIFNGSESLRIRLAGAYEMVRNMESLGTKNRNFYEITPQLSLVFPRFLCPGLSDTYIGRTGQTSFTASYTWQNRPEFYKRYLSFDWKYSWYTNRRKCSHILDLYNITYSRVPWILPAFKSQYLDKSTNALLKQNYTDQLVTRTFYTFSYSDIQANISKKSGQTFSLMADMSGTLPFAICSWSKQSKNTEGQYEILGVPFSQYARIDLDYSRVFRANANNTLAWHIGLGVAVPFKNSDQIPYERRYFAGGPNSVRGWSTRTLGPGKYKSAGSSDFFNQTGDVKFLLQAEYRYHISKMLEYAMFLDAGNVWTIKEYENQQGGVFKFSEFYKQIALSYGIGLRIDLSFILVRFDFAMKAHDPSDDKPWVIAHPKFKRDFAWHFAIGYPF